jgi:hypothetical protein
MTGDITTSNSGDPGSWRTFASMSATRESKGLTLPPMEESLGSVIGQGQTMRVDGTNVVRVPFGVRQPRRARPARPDHWATLVLPFQPGSNPTPPPRAA